MSAIEEPGKTSTKKVLTIIGCGCGGLILVGILAVAGIFFFVTKALKSSDAYTESIAAIESNEAAVAALGTPVTPSFFVAGNVGINNGEGEVDLTIPVSGPKGNGVIRVKGTKSAGGTAWTYDTWQLEVEGRPEPIPLGE